MPTFEYYSELSKMLPVKFLTHDLLDERGEFDVISKWRLVIFPDPKTKNLYTPTELLLSGYFDDLAVPDKKAGKDIVESYEAGMDLNEVLKRKKELLYNPDHEKYIIDQLASSSFTKNNETTNAKVSSKKSSQKRTSLKIPIVNHTSL